MRDKDNNTGGGGGGGGGRGAKASFVSLRNVALV